MKSIEKLRKYAPITSEWDAILNAAADEIEAEIAERYMLLPADADGVPIKVGETCYDTDTAEPFEVSSIEWNGVCWSAWSKPEKRHIYNHVSHVKPRTLEDVLRKLVDDALDGTGRDPLLKDWKALVARYADEIRELLGVEQ